ncbi:MULTISPECIES: hypothetical protein [Streptosporangium]|uniref:Uncharacterized protein n=1 Tax=Streptosporangium jomthongense TaxID=1193683 RepID=A0ABV8F339_9ACTN
MGNSHLVRLRRIRDLISQGDRYDTSHTRLVCYSGSGFTGELLQVAQQESAELISLDHLYA